MNTSPSSCGNVAEGERRVLQVIKRRDEDTRHPSVFFFTTHKCASTFVVQLLREISQYGPLRHFDYAENFAALGNKIDVNNPYKVMSWGSEQLFHPFGEFYGPMRKPVRIKQPPRFKGIFFLRDPRDVLVSAYYSFGFSHPLPTNDAMKERFLENRERIQKAGIDSFALNSVGSLIEPTYMSYLRLKNKLGAALCLRYDEFAEDPRNFIERTAEFASIDELPSDVIGKLADMANPVQGTVDITQHQRSGRSAQFMDELKPATVDQLNLRLARVLEAWNFKI